MTTHYKSDVSHAEFISIEQTERFMVELEDVAPRGVFTCNGVSYVVPDTNFHFTGRKRLALIR
jgi:hypothetical protein